MLPLLLHMHQPDYRDPVTGDPVLPWVRKHALRGYRDVPWLLKKTGGRATINLVPSLLDQIDHYANGGEDPLLRLLRTPVAELPVSSQCVLADAALLGSERRFGWFPAFARLRDRTAETLGVAGRLDRIVWGELSWFGYSARADYPAINALIARGSGFTQADLDRLVAIEREILRGLQALYRDLPEVSCSPYFHPILPLLVNTAHAQRNLPGVPDPGFAWPEDARAQLQEGRARVRAWTGAEVRGLWPSEGSVSPEVACMVRDLGFGWMATDEEVLARSSADADPGRPATFDGCTLVFRDHALSDLIGFAYQDVDGEKAAADLLRRSAGRSAVLALDGENPWEHYADAGLAFLTAVFRSGQTATISDFVDRTPPQPIARLHTGSWINANFQIWIGHEEDRLAWRLLAAARRAWDECGRPPEARPHLHAAEGSDWFWWYGDEFSTPVADIFDALFRAHVTAAWRAMGREPAPRLSQPIKAAQVDTVDIGAIGVGDGWLAWQNASILTVRAGAMARVGGPRRLWVGWRGGQLAVRARDAGGWAVATTGVPVDFVDGNATIEAGGELVLLAPDGSRAGSWPLHEPPRSVS